MIFKQYELGCLSLFSYLIGDETTGRAVVVDPQRDVSEYIADAASLGLTIERVIETHFHADFLSGHLEMADATGAVISYGDVAEADFAFEGLAHGQRLSLGEVTLEIRHTPGHTPESISIVVYEHEGDDPWAVLTGDALFIGDVGRPDLLTSAGWTADDLARQLYHSVHEQLLTLPDATRRLPRSRRRLRVRQEPLDCGRVHDRRAARHQLRARPDDGGSVRRGGHPGPVRRPAVLRVRREREPQGARAARRDPANCRCSTSTS